MSVKHLKYTNRVTGETVRAIKVTERNYQKVAEWADSYSDTFGEALETVSLKTGDVSNHRVKIYTKKGWRVAKVGEYVVRHGKRDPRPATGNRKVDWSGYDFTVGKDAFELEFRKSA